MIERSLKKQKQHENRGKYVTVGDPSHGVSDIQMAWGIAKLGLMIGGGVLVYRFVTGDKPRR